YDTVAARLGWPVMVKPAASGSSLGMSRVDRAADLAQAHKEARFYDDTVLAEAWVDGTEVTVGVVDGEPLPVLRLQTAPPNTKAGPGPSTSIPPVWAKWWRLIASGSRWPLSRPWLARAGAGWTSW
ncbi:MAG: hypothetical protein ABEJ96_10850, partial [Thiohalorhabdaceae bacterium]